MNGKENKVEKLSIEFALEVIGLYKLLKSKNEYVISQQLLKSGTSIGANIQEAQAAQTKPDFIAKMSIASKEARETRYWLFLIQKSQIIAVDVSNLTEKINALINLLTKIVKTSQDNLRLAK